MNRQKLLVLCLGSVLGILPAAMADDTPPPPPPPAGTENPPPPADRGQHHGHMEERLVKALNLTPDQESKWKAIGQQEKDAMESLHQDASLSKDQKRAKMGDIRKDFEGQRRALLTSEQQAKFDELQAKMRERMQHRHDQDGGTPPPPPPADPSANK